MEFKHAIHIQHAAYLICLAATPCWSKPANKAGLKSQVGPLLYLVPLSGQHSGKPPEVLSARNTTAGDCSACAAALSSTARLGRSSGDQFQQFLSLQLLCAAARQAVLCLCLSTCSRSAMCSQPWVQASLRDWQRSAMVSSAFVTLTRGAMLTGTPLPLLLPGRHMEALPYSLLSIL